MYGILTLSIAVFVHPKDAQAIGILSCSLSLVSSNIFNNGLGLEYIVLYSATPRELIIYRGLRQPLFCSPSYPT